MTIIKHPPSLTDHSCKDQHQPAFKLENRTLEQIEIKCPDIITEDKCREERTVVPPTAEPVDRTFKQITSPVIKSNCKRRNDDCTEIVKSKLLRHFYKR